MGPNGESALPEGWDVVPLGAIIVGHGFPPKAGGAERPGHPSGWNLSSSRTAFRARSSVSPSSTVNHWPVCRR